MCAERQASAHVVNGDFGIAKDQQKAKNAHNAKKDLSHREVEGALMLQRFFVCHDTASRCIRCKATFENALPLSRS